MSISENIRYGIDLGTTNSSTAILLGDRMHVVRNAHNDETTPSVVAFWRSNGERGAVVGRQARNMVTRKGARVASKFKESMGDPSVVFDGTDPPETPCELSSRVLRELIASAGRVAGLPAPCAAVITVPAAFKNPARDDTKKAGQLAGLDYVELFPEPAAAALAYGRTADTSRNPVWLAYDLGGGTFDAALVRGENGVFTVIDSEGERHLGGKDFDGAIVRELVLPRLSAPLRTRIAPGSSEWTLLEMAAEDAKCALSTQDSVPFQAEIFGEPVTIPLHRSDLIPIQARLFAPTIKCCRELLARNHFEPHHIERVILVGGPLLSPDLRDMVERGYDDGKGFAVQGLGIAVDRSVDPLTAIAQGAAIRAAARRIPASVRAARDAGARAGQPVVAVELNVSSQVQAEDVLVAGSVKPLRADIADGARWSVQVERIDANLGVVWRSEPAAVPESGKFALRVPLEPGHNRFEVRVLDSRQNPVEVEGGRFEVMRGIAIGELTLARGLGVADHNGATVWFFRKGEPLNRKVSRLFTTTVALERGRDADAVVIPVVEGFEEKACLNAEVYTLRISAQQAGISVPKGAYIEVELSIDESQQLHVAARFKDFPVKAASGTASLAPDRRKVADRLAAVRRDVELFRQVRQESRTIGEVVGEIDQGDLVGEVEQLLELGTPQRPAPWDKAADRVLQLARMLDRHRTEVDELLSWLAHRARCDENVRRAKNIVEETEGLPESWKEEFKRLCAQYDEACVKRDRELSEHIAFGAIPAHMKANDTLRHRVGGAATNVATAQTTTGGGLAGTVKTA